MAKRQETDYYKKFAQDTGRTNAEHVSKDLKEACITDQEISEYLSELPPHKLRDMLCDMVGISHHASKETILQEIENKI